MMNTDAGETRRKGQETAKEVEALPEGEETEVQPPAMESEGEPAEGDMPGDDTSNGQGTDGRNPQETIPGELPQAWDYVEEDETEVTLHGREELSGMLPGEALADLERGLLTFLKENGEYRRELEVRPESVQATEEGATFEIRFCTERLDGGEVTATYGQEGWSFIIRPREGGTGE